MDYSYTGERRKAPRTNLQAPVRITMEATPDREIQGEIINISPGGLSFFLTPDQNGLQEKDNVVCSFAFPLVGSVTKPGEVCYTRFGVNKELKRIQIYGLKFGDPDLKIWAVLKKYSNNGPNYFMETAKRLSGQDIPSDQRKDFRVDADLTGLLSSGGIQDIICIVNDISYTGTRISTFVQIPQHMELTLEITFGSDVVEVPLKVVWSLPETLASGQKIYYHGLLFLPLQPENLEILKKLVQWIGGFK